jgi:hypothetical protein
MYKPLSDAELCLRLASGDLSDPGIAWARAQASALLAGESDSRHES